MAGPDRFQTGIGVDGCRAGWFWVRVDAEDYEFGVAPNFLELCNLVPAEAPIFVDIPIGLTDSPDGRGCDTAARKLLKSRASTVFSAPARSVLDCVDYQGAKRVSRSVKGKALSRQAFGILPKIREVDHCLQKHPALRTHVTEGHPEVSFYSLTGEPMQARKKSKQGFADRRRVLMEVWPPAEQCIDEALARYLRKDVARDDILDAIVMAITAASRTPLTTLPERPAVDPTGLPMQICYLSRSHPNAPGRR